jgi:nucleoid-associated protein YgaU
MPFDDNQAPALREDNPYAYGSIFVFDEGDYILDGPEVELSPSEKDKYYTVRKDDDIWNIAFAAYGTSKWWWLILFANNLDFGMELPVGKTLRIPDLLISQLVL